METNPTPIDWRAMLITALNLSPAEGETEIPDATIEAKVNEMVAASAQVPELQQASTTAAEQLANANAEIERIRGEYQALFDREEAARKQQTEAEVNTILEQYAPRLTTPEAKERIRALLLSDRESGMDILKGLPEPAAAAPDKKTPPDPQHQPGKEGGLTPEQKLAKQNELIAAIRKETRDGRKPFPDYDSAFNEARRRQPELFA